MSVTRDASTDSDSAFWPTFHQSGLWTLLLILCTIDRHGQRPYHQEAHQAFQVCLIPAECPEVVLKLSF